MVEMAGGQRKRRRIIATILTFIFLIIGFVKVSADNEDFSWGVVVGANHSWDSDLPSGATVFFSPGFSTGITARYDFLDWLNLSFTSKYQFLNTRSATEVEFEIRDEYGVFIRNETLTIFENCKRQTIELQLTSRIMFNMTDLYDLFIGVGIKTVSPISEHIDNLNRYLFLKSFGLSFVFELGSDFVMLDHRFTTGVSFSLYQPKTFGSTASNTYLTSLEYYVGYIF